MQPDRLLETYVTLILADQAPDLAQAHDELYPERIDEHIPLSLTLLYPFVPRDSLDESHLQMLRDFFASRKPLVFDIARVAQWEGGGAVYGRPGSDPPPHASLTLDGGADPETLKERVERRLHALLPAHFEVVEATLMEEYEPDRMRITHTFPFGG